MSEPIKVLIIGYVWPEPRSSAAGVRDYGLVQNFLDSGYEVHFASSSKNFEARDELAKKFAISVHNIQANDSTFDLWIKDLNPSCVVFDRFVIEEQFGFRVRENCPGAIRVLDTQDLHFLRRSREQSIKSPNENVNQDDLLRELASIYRSDLTLVLSDFELDLLQKNYSVPGKLLDLCRFSYELKPMDQNPSREQRKDFIWIGNFRHHPNLDSIFWLKQKIWPLIRKKIPDAIVHVYGAYPPKEVSQLHDPQGGFRIEDQASDAQKVMSQARVNLAPLRFGAGIKGKITDGWSVGTPVCATPIAAEGMAGDLPWGGLLALDEQEFSDCAVQLYQDSDLWDEMSQKGFRIMRMLYEQRAVGERLTSRIKKISENKIEHRENNWIGKMLWYQSNRSTEYFSRWIELKNQIPKK